MAALSRSTQAAQATATASQEATISSSSSTSTSSPSTSIRMMRTAPTVSQAATMMRHSRNGTSKSSPAEAASASTASCPPSSTTSGPPPPAAAAAAPPPPLPSAAPITQTSGGSASPPTTPTTTTSTTTTELHRRRRLRTTNNSSSSSRSGLRQRHQPRINRISSSSSTSSSKTSHRSAGAGGLGGWASVAAVMTRWALWLGVCACLTQSWSRAEAAISNRANKPQAASTLPRFLSRGHTYRAVVGDTLVLPCEVENLGALVLLWRRGPNVLTASQLMVTQDERIRLMDGYNLEISDLEPQDAGDYVCQISDKVNKDQIHTVEILVPPSIRAIPQTGQLTARKGGTITLECKASGNPVPTIFWTKKGDTTAATSVGIDAHGNSLVRNGHRIRRSRPPASAAGKTLAAAAMGSDRQQQQQQQQLLQLHSPSALALALQSPQPAPAPRIGDGPILTLERVERQQAGIYQCTADNNVGEPVTVDMRLDVLYPPDISVEKSWIHSGEGFEAQLVCIVHADPAPTVSWLQNSFPLQQTDRRTMASRGNRHTLNIRHVQPEDFGNYSCVADNSLGRSKKYMEVSGRPGPAEFHSAPWSRSPDSYNLTWKVDSYPPLQEVRLLYRKLMVNETYQQPGRWHDVLLTPTPRATSEPLSHIMSFTLKGLQAGSVYEAIVQAKNRYGWNEISDIFQFYTQRSASEPRTVEYEMVASSTSRSSASSVRSSPAIWRCGCASLMALALAAIWSRQRHAIGV